MRNVMLLCIFLSTITTGLCIDLAWDYMYGSYIGMHPAFALVTIIITWLLCAFAIWLMRNPLLDNCHQLSWPKLDT